MRVFGGWGASSDFCSCCGALDKTPEAIVKSHNGILICRENKGFPIDLPVQEVQTKNGSVFVQIDTREGYV